MQVLRYKLFASLFTRIFKAYDANEEEKKKIFLKERKKKNKKGNKNMNIQAPRGGKAKAKVAS